MLKWSAAITDPDRLISVGSHTSAREAARRDRVEGRANLLVALAATLLAEAAVLLDNSGHSQYPMACNAEKAGRLSADVHAMIDNQEDLQRLVEHYGIENCEVLFRSGVLQAAVS